MQMRKVKEERGSIAVYVLVTLLSFLLVLSAIYFTTTSVRKSQLSTILKVKESYEKDNDKIDEIYETQFIKNNKKQGLILYYDGVNNTGNGHSNSENIWIDLTGNGNDGILNGNPTWEDEGLVFDGTDDNVEINVTNLNKLTQGTVIVVAKINDWGEDSSTLFYKGSGLDWNDSHIQIARNASSTEAISTTISDGESSTQTESVVAAYTSEKMHIAMSWDGTVLKNYKDGTLNSTINTSILPSQESIMCYLGKGPENSRWLNGTIYKVCIYNRVLTDEEIENIYSEL